MKNARHAAFTLIELMVVVTILILLFALLAPTLTLGLDHAKQAQCQRGARAIGVAFASYSSANNQCIAKTYEPNSGWTWQMTLVKGGYVPIRSPITDWCPLTDAFVCPSDPRLTEVNPPNKGQMSSFFMPVMIPDYERFGTASDAYSGDLSQPGEHAITVGVMEFCYWGSYYAGTDAMGNGVWKERTLKPVPQPFMTTSRIPNPAGTMLTIEGIGFVYGYWHFDEGWVGCERSWAISRGTGLWPSAKYVRRHIGKQEVLACDGSVKITLVEDTAGQAFSSGFHANRLDWDNYDEWVDKMYAPGGPLATGCHGMWTLDPSD